MNRVQKGLWTLVGLAAAALAATSCIGQERTQELAESAEEATAAFPLRWLDTADPIADAQKALAGHHYELMGVRGYTLTVPALATTDWRSYDKLYGVKPIEGTSDMLIGQEHARLVAKAMVYARQYNRYVLEHADYGGDKRWQADKKAAE